MEFDVQRYLEVMRTEARADTLSLATKVDDGFSTFNKRMQEHELSDQASFARLTNRIVPLETSHKTIKWFVRACIVAGIGMLLDVFLNHVGPALLALTRGPKP